MAGELEHPERDIDDELEIKLGLPGILSGTWRRRWTARRETVVDRAAEIAGVTDHELGERVRDDETVGDIFWAAIQRAGEVGDPVYLDALGRLVAAALDPAKVDEASYLSGELVKLDAVQIRTLVRACFMYWVVPEDPELGVIPLGNPDEANFGQARTVKVQDVVSRLSVSEATALGVLLRLASAGFLHDTTPRTATPESERAIGYIGHPLVPWTPPEMWEPTNWAMRALLLLYPNLTYGAPNGAGAILVRHTEDS